MKCLPLTDSGGSIELWNVKDPTFSVESALPVRFQPYAAATLYTPGRFTRTISIRGWVNYRATARLKGLGKSQNSKAIIGIRVAFYRLVNTHAVSSSNGIYIILLILSVTNIYTCTLKLFFVWMARVELSPLLLRSFVGLLYQTWMIVE
jgi:hypothetical protein